MKNAQYKNFISSTLKTVACENIVSEHELTQASDKSLQDIQNEQEQNKNQEDKTPPTQ